MNELTFPFKVKEFGQEFLQSRCFIKKRTLFQEKNIEFILSQVLKYSFSDKVNIKGLVAEVLGYQLFEHSMHHFLSQNSNYDGNMINVKKDYILKSNFPFLIKADENSRIFILKEDDKKIENDSKFGFKKYAELDALFLLKKLNETKNKREFFPIEIKSGSININLEYIYNQIISPLELVWKTPVHYVLIGFKDEMYLNSKNNQLNPKLKEICSTLRELGNDFIPIHFPFSKQELSEVVDQILINKTGIGDYKASYDINSKKLILTSPLGNRIRGTFIPD